MNLPVGPDYGHPSLLLKVRKVRIRKNWQDSNPQTFSFQILAGRHSNRCAKISAEFKPTSTVCFQYTQTNQTKPIWSIYLSFASHSQAAKMLATVFVAQY